MVRRGKGAAKFRVPGVTAVHWKPFDESAGLWMLGQTLDGVCILRSVALRLADGTLAVVGPIRESPRESFTELDALGRPVFLLAPNFFHHLGLAAYAEKFPDAQVVASAKAANAHDFILGNAEGYDTIVGERGARVSGGERQRISIARAILRDPRILILDEATASVDTQTEAQIQEALERLVKGRTTFAIAHRLSTLKNAHRLLILEDGKLAEIGTHNELIAKDGIYAKLCRMQTEMSKLRAV